MQPLKLLRWLPHYFLSWNALFFALGAALWFWATPARETLTAWDWQWMALLLARNAALVLVVFGALGLRLYNELIDLKVTLSYFVDPNPGFSANVDPQRYQSLVFGSIYAAWAKRLARSSGA